MEHSYTEFVLWRFARSVVMWGEKHAFHLSNYINQLLSFYGNLFAFI